MTMTQPTAPAVPEGTTNGPIPPLKDGDRLTRAEFERRYEAMPEVKKAELIEGVVHMPSPVRVQHHGNPNRYVSTWLGTYEAYTPGLIGADNTTARLDLDNEQQPDALLMIDALRGGQARISDDDYIEGGPELVAEISGGRGSVDLGERLRVYLRNRVQEYIVWRVPDREIDWFVLRDRQYQRLQPDENGVCRSVVFPGLWLNVPALLRRDLAAVLATLHEGMATPEHADFVTRLNPPQP
jgi:hypothetical protein